MVKNLDEVKDFDQIIKTKEIEYSNYKENV